MCRGATYPKVGHKNRSIYPPSLPLVEHSSHIPLPCHRWDPTTTAFPTWHTSVPCITHVLALTNLASRILLYLSTARLFCHVVHHHTLLYPTRPYFLVASSLDTPCIYTRTPIYPIISAKMSSFVVGKFDGRFTGYNRSKYDMSQNVQWLCALACALFLKSYDSIG